MNKTAFNTMFSGNRFICYPGLLLHPCADGKTGWFVSLLAATLEQFQDQWQVLKKEVPNITRALLLSQLLNRSADYLKQHIPDELAGERLFLALNPAVQPGFRLEIPDRAAQFYYASALARSGQQLVLVDVPAKDACDRRPAPSERRYAGERQPLRQ